MSVPHEITARRRSQAKSKRGGWLLLLGLVTTGCAGVKYAVDNYSDVKPISFTSTAQKTPYRIFDKPAEGRLMITPSIANSLGQGMIKGVTLTSATPPEILFEQAAIEFLASTGRTCSATRTFLIVDPQFEVQYRCGGSPSTGEAIP